MTLYTIVQSYFNKLKSKQGSLLKYFYGFCSLKYSQHFLNQEKRDDPNVFYILRFLYMQLKKTRFV